MNITKEMIGAAHDVMLLRGDFILSANLLAKIYEAMRNKEPMENRELLEQQLAAKQARIDELMLEYCHNEMTEEQLEEWSKHQRAVKVPK